jgi:hypothetical protein
MNRRINLKKWLFIGMIGIAATAAWADSPIQWRGSPGWEPTSAYCRLYDNKTVVTLEGSVERVEKIIPMKGMGDGVHFVLKTSSETIPVQLGPTWFVEKQPVQILAQDVVEVTGSRVSCDGKPVIMATLIKKGGQIVRYRDAKGIPGWAGGPPH